MSVPNYQAIEVQLMHISDGILTPLNPSTATVQGKFTNVELSSDIVDIFVLTGNLISASSNDGTILNASYVPPPVEEKKSKRGRKKKEKPKTKRCKNGKFGSMIQFEVKSIYKRNKVYKIKAFNKETFQVPGVLDPYFGDVMPALNELAEFLEKSLGSEKVKVIGIKPLMRNYICRIFNPAYKINLAAFAKFITHYQTSEMPKYDLLDKLRQRSTFRHNNLIQEIEKYIPNNHMGIISIQFDLEKYAGIKIKFRRPLHEIKIPKDEIKDITIKIYQSGKINIDGGKEIPEIEELYLWLNTILIKNRDELIIDISRVVIDINDHVNEDDDQFVNDTDFQTDAYQDHNILQNPEVSQLVRINATGRSRHFGAALTDEVDEIVDDEPDDDETLGMDGGEFE
jgi:hypothetical protein